MLERDKRIKNDAQHMEKLLSSSNLITFHSVSDVNGIAPDRYIVEFKCKGLIREGGQLAISNYHKIMIYLHADYPTQQPRIGWVTPIFHPNIKGGNVCLGRSWTPAMTLDELCIVLGEMIQYKLYNLNDPLDGFAAEIIQSALSQNPEFLPIDDRNLLVPLSEAAIHHDDEIITVEQL